MSPKKNAAYASVVEGRKGIVPTRSECEALGPVQGLRDAGRSRGMAARQRSVGAPWRRAIASLGTVTLPEDPT